MYRQTFNDVSSPLYDHLTGILHVIQEFDQKIGSLGKFWLGNRLFIYVSDPAQIEAILNHPACIDKGESYKFLVDSLGFGLITSKCKEKNSAIAVI